jgi:molybdopterin-containing oxidoreductase family membrane subunit
MKSEQTFVAAFSHVDDFLSCLRILKEKGYEIRSVFSPVRLPEMQEILGMSVSKTRLFTLIGGLVGGTALVGLAAYAHLSFKLIVYGKPILAWIPWVVVAFEGTILLASLSSFVSWVFKAGLPQPSMDSGYGPEFSGDKFGILVAANEERRSEAERIVREGGAEEIRDVST